MSEAGPGEESDLKREERLRELLQNRPNSLAVAISRPSPPANRDKDKGKDKADDKDKPIASSSSGSSASTQGERKTWGRDVTETLSIRKGTIKGSPSRSKKIPRSFVHF
jgi:hypothetical protein